MERLTKLEILNETIAFYNADVTKRSIDELDNCSYNGEHGNHCAIGRCMVDSLKEQGVKLKGNRAGIQNLAEINGLTIDEVFEEKYRGHEIYFWRSLQELHDEDDFWDNAGLNAQGEAYANEICKQFNLKPETNA